MKISRTKIELFCQCPRCFYLDRIGRIPRPSIPSFTLNSAVDALLKREFDSYRQAQQPHPLMHLAGIKAIPFLHPDIDKWRNNKIGVQTAHGPSKLLVFGAIDDVWIDQKGTLYVVDYKATSSKNAPTLEGKIGYARQMEIYQWLFKQNGFDVSKTGYFVYCNGLKNGETFGARLDFEIEILAHEGNSDWVEGTLLNIRKCLDGGHIPPSAPECEHCSLRLRIEEFETWHKTFLIDLGTKRSRILGLIHLSYADNPLLIESFEHLFSLFREESMGTKGSFNPSVILDALYFAMEKHAGQFRKNSTQNPYILHPLQVVQILWTEAKIRNPEIISAGLLYDVLEDTNTTQERLPEAFGQKISNIVQELTNDPDLLGDENKKRQIEKASEMSEEARIIKLADRIQNLCEMKTDPPQEWD